MTADKSSGNFGPLHLAVIRPMRLAGVRATISVAARGICIGLLTAGLGVRMAAATDNMMPPGQGMSSHAEAQVASAKRPGRADFGGKPSSRDTRHIADWVVDSGDNQRMPFLIVDKAQATVFVFDAQGQLRGSAPALLGLARGDHSVPGIGDRALSTIRPEERTTPAGRFVAAMDRNLRGEEIIWVDYDSAVSMHRVITSNARERRLERLNSPTVLDNRISFGCINVPAKFFDQFVLPAFKGTNGIVYVLPETRAAREVFASYDVEERARQLAASPAPAVQVASEDGRH